MKVIFIIIISLYCGLVFCQSRKVTYLKLEVSNGITFNNNINYVHKKNSLLQSSFLEYGVLIDFEKRSGFGFETGLLLNVTNIKFQFIDTTAYFNTYNQKVKFANLKIPIKFSFNLMNNDISQFRVIFGTELYRNISNLNNSRSIYNVIDENNINLEYLVNRVDLLNISASSFFGIQYDLHLSKKLFIYTSANISLGLTKGAFFNFFYTFKNKEFPYNESKGSGISNYKNDYIGLSLGLKYSISTTNKK